MQAQDFKQWLIDNKKMGVLSAKDVVSRCNRVVKLVNQARIENCSFDMLINSTEFQSCSSCVKSQLKRALTLYNEYEKTIV